MQQQNLNARLAEKSRAGSLIRCIETLGPDNADAYHGPDNADAYRGADNADAHEGMPGERCPEMQSSGIRHVPRASI